MVSSSEPWFVSIVRILAVPVTVVVLGLTGMILYRDAINEAIRRMRGLTAGPLRADLAEGQEGVNTPPVALGEVNAVVEATTGATLSATDTTSLSGTQQPVITATGLMPTSGVQVETMKFLGADASTDTPGKRLLRYWAAAWSFERIYRVIFGTQIRVLQKANVTPVPIATIQEQYEASRTLGNKTQSFENYIGFVVSNGLLAANADRTSFAITPVGRFFLTYIATEGYPVDKTL